MLRLSLHIAFGAGTWTGVASGGLPKAKLVVDLERPRQVFRHTWEECMGSGHAALTLRADWRQHVAVARRDLGVKRVRFHGILDDDMSTSFGSGSSSYVNVDSWADFMEEQGMSAILELGFMPRWLARRADPARFECDHTINHYVGCVDPPSNFTQWGDVVGSLVAHLVERYGLDRIAEEWWFEVWNEPNLNGQRDPLVEPTGKFAGGGDWWGTGSEYFELYAHAARAIKAVSPRLRVGGPATTNSKLWVERFVDFCNNASVPLDFVSSHAYAGGDSGINSVTSLLTQLTEAKEAAGRFPHLVTEWGGSWRHGNTVMGGGGNVNADQIGNATSGRCHDDYTAASFIVAVADRAHGIADALSYWCVTDVFEESGFPVANSSFFGGFGVLNVYGVPKPAYRAFQLLHESGGARLHTTFSGDSSCLATVGAIATMPAQGELHFILYSQATLEDPIEPVCELEVIVSGQFDVVLEGTLRRIDGAHANPMQRWIDLGMPQYPTKQEIGAISRASELVVEQLPVTTTSSAAAFTVSIPAQSVAAIRLAPPAAGIFV